ncbi:hypothetical protein Tco_1120929 [Tanacetum coccineum]|uniref:Uncharacterized protein n=1 Tax=Tanacetum coccineum TaxID=301880 RepID=A0ABQ5IZW7_9ASTR
MKGECVVIKEKENAMEKECDELNAKCKVAVLEGEKSKLEGVKTQLRQETKDVKHDQRRLTSFIVFYGRCAALEEVSKMKEPFDLEKVKVTANPLDPIETLLSKKPQTLRCPTPSKTSAPSQVATHYVAPSKVSASLQQVTPSQAPLTKHVSPPREA